MAITVLRGATKTPAPGIAFVANAETRIERPAVWTRPAWNAGFGARSANRDASEESECGRCCPAEELPAVDLPGHPRQYFLNSDVLRAVRHARLTSRSPACVTFSANVIAVIAASSAAQRRPCSPFMTERALTLPFLPTATANGSAFTLYRSAADFFSSQITLTYSGILEDQALTSFSDPVQKTTRSTLR